MENEKIKTETVNEREERTLKFWRDNKVFEASLNKESPKGEFVFYDGPPFATGQPHYGHVLPSTMKDIIPRYKTMKGFHVSRQWGWDCHGLPIENLIESELGLKTKKDIEALGIDKFNEEAKKSVLRYEDDWKRIIPRVGRWVDMEHDYKTMDWKYTETIWWIFKTLFDKNLIYEGYKPMHLCPRCETTLANFEVNQGYKDITDISLIGKFELEMEPGTFVLAWTTTPWTLPGNVALAVNPSVIYCKIKIKKEDLKIEDQNSKLNTEALYILAKDRLMIVKEEYEVLEEFGGDTLIGERYKPLFDYYSSDAGLKSRENGWKIYGAEFVTTVDGTGVVHIAPAFGEDDMNLGMKEKLPFVQHVGTNGQMRPEVKDFAGLFVKPKDNKETGVDHQSTDIEVIKFLARKGLLFAKEKLVHSYPHCWRCDTPLLNYASSSWFVKVTEFKNKIVANNQKTRWVPEAMRDGRFGNWLEGARDWAISRARYWGAPLPVWRCVDCKELEVIGSLQDLKKKVVPKNKYFLMRHGQAESNVKGIITCDPDTNSLTEVGRVQVLDSAKKLSGIKIDLIFSSDYTRTRQTAEIVAQSIGYDPGKIMYDSRLHEVAFGAYNRETIEKYHSHFKDLLDRFVTRSEGGENLTDVKNRVMSFVYELEEKYKDKNILIVSHGDPVWLAQMGSRGMIPKELTEDEVPSKGGPVEVKFHKTYRDLKYLGNAEVLPLDFYKLPHNNNFELDLHKPYIDHVKFSCKCGGEYKRISEVFDCWFESGSMPYAQVHYPFENKEKFEANFPADFIAEGVDQTRGWFYSLMVLSTALFDEPTFKQVIVNGMVLAEDGQKMSKRLKNYPDLMYVVEKYGADAMRYYMITSPIVRAEDLRFSEKGVDEIYKKLILRLQNVVSFYELYGQDTDFPKVGPPISRRSDLRDNVLDLWIQAKLSTLAEEVEKNLKDYELDRAARPILDFVDDLSTWYLRRSRERFKSDDAVDKLSALTTTRSILFELSKIIAPFVPFIAEEIYMKVGGPKKSVHLEDWPFFGETLDDQTEMKEKIFEEMKDVRGIVSLALDERKKLGIPVRQPLNKLIVKKAELKNKPELLQLVIDEVNVKKVVFDEMLATDIQLDTEITEELKAEGNLRELIRALQDMRKSMGLRPDQKVVLTFFGGEKEISFVNKFTEELKKTVNISKIKKEENVGEEIKIGDIIIKATLTL